MTTISENEKQALIRQREKISDVVLKELKQSERIFIVDGEERFKEEEDFRMVFIQSVEHYAALAIPFFV